MSVQRLIDANALIEALPIVTEDRKITLYGAVADFMIMISAMPTVDAVEVVHGRWEMGRKPNWQMPMCSVCGNQTTSRYKYCPNCGAKMDGERVADGKENKT